MCDETMRFYMCARESHDVPLTLTLCFYMCARESNDVSLTLTLAFTCELASLMTCPCMVFTAFGGAASDESHCLRAITSATVFVGK